MKKSALDIYVEAYNKHAREAGLPLYADPVPETRLRDLVNPGRPRYMTSDEKVDFLKGVLVAVSKHAEEMFPVAKHGDKFFQGRKENSGGPIRKKIAQHLKKNPKLKTRELWHAIGKKPPRGWALEERPRTRLAPEFVGPNGETMGFGRFSNVCSEERRRLKKEITG